MPYVRDIQLSLKIRRWGRSVQRWHWGSLMTYILFIQNSFYSPLPPSILVFILLLFTCWRHDRCHSSRYPLNSKQQRRKKGWQKGISESLLSLLITEGKSFQHLSNSFLLTFYWSKLRHSLGILNQDAHFQLQERVGRFLERGSVLVMTCLDQLQCILLCLMHRLLEQRQTSNLKEKYLKWTLVAWGRGSELANGQCLSYIERNVAMLS